MITKVVRNHRIQWVSSVKEFQDQAAKSDDLSFYVTSGKQDGRFVTLSKVKRSFQFPGPGGRNPSPNNPRDLKEFEELLTEAPWPGKLSGRLVETDLQDTLRARCRSAPTRLFAVSSA